MTDDQVKEILNRVLTWPRERRADAAEMLLALEAHEGEFYAPDEDEWAAIEQGLAQVERGDFVADAEITELLSPRRK